MKAIVYHRFGPPDVLELADIPKPTPGDREVLVRVRATTVTAADWRARSLEVPRGFGPIARLVFGFSRPRQPILGMDLSGDIEAVGKDVRKLRPGDPVFASTGFGMGCYVEYRCVSEDGALAPKPANLSHEEAAAIPFGGATALRFLRRATIRSGDEVLVNGASGACGTAAVQLAKHFGARVTGVCSTANLELVRSLGADRVIDYTSEDDFTRSGERYDIIMDTAGTAPYARSARSLKKGGRLLLVLCALPDMLRAPWLSMTTDKKVIAFAGSANAEDLRYLADLAEAGRFRPVIDRRYPFEQVVEAHRYVDTGRKRGNVVLTP